MRNNIESWGKPQPTQDNLIFFDTIRVRNAQYNTHFLNWFLWDRGPGCKFSARWMDSEIEMERWEYVTTTYAVAGWVDTGYITVSCNNSKIVNICTQIVSR